MIHSINKLYLKALRKQEFVLQSVAIKGMKVRGFSKHPIHPKHLFDEKKANLLSTLLKPKLRFLDLGSGMGSECIKAAQAGAIRSVGLEYNPESIKVARHRASEVISKENLKTKIEFFENDLEEAQFPFEDQSFDLIHFSNVLEHLHNRTEVLREIKRVKSPDGIALISVPNRDTRWKRKQRSVGIDSRDDDDHKIEYSKESLEEELSQAGLKRQSELMPIIPSFPWNGLLACLAIIGKKPYIWAQNWKRDYVQKNPDESIGWEFIVK